MLRDAAPAACYGRRGNVEVDEPELQPARPAWVDPRIGAT
jgi:hypothetical protein